MPYKSSYMYLNEPLLYVLSQHNLLIVFLSNEGLVEPAQKLRPATTIAARIHKERVYNVDKFIHVPLAPLKDFAPMRYNNKYQNRMCGPIFILSTHLRCVV